MSKKKTSKPKGKITKTTVKPKPAKTAKAKVARRQDDKPTPPRNAAPKGDAEFDPSRTKRKANGKSNGKASGVKQETEVRVTYPTVDLPVELTPEELKERTAELVDVLNAIDARKGEFLIAAGAYRKEMKELTAKERLARSAVTEGHEKRPVDCIETRNYRTNTYTLVRRDTGKTEVERALEAHEQQPTLPYPEQDPLAAPTGPMTPAEFDALSPEQRAAVKREFEDGIAKDKAKQARRDAKSDSEMQSDFDFAESDPHPRPPDQTLDEALDGDDIPFG